MPEYICPRDGQTFSKRPPGGRCPTHKVAVEALGKTVVTAGKRKSPTDAKPTRASSRRPARGRRPTS